MDGRLIISVDDFGLTQGVNQAVQKLVGLGTISATNLMANMPYVEDAVALAETYPRLSIGIHLNLTQGKPVLSPDEVPTLVDENGAFHPLGIMRKKRGAISTVELQKEVEAQVQVVHTLLGSRIDHWNSHQGVHRFQPFLRVISAVCHDYHVPAMRSHRHYFARVAGDRLSLTHPGLKNLHKFGLKRALVETYYDWVAMRERKQFTMPDGLIAVQGGGTIMALEQAIKNTLPAGLWEIACHAATTTDGLSQTTMLESRVEEFKLLSSDSIRDALSNQPEKLAGFN